MVPSLFQLITRVNSDLPESGDVFGVQANGLCLISDFILDPSVDCNRPFVFHLQRGQLLDIALKDGYLIGAQSEVLSPITIHMSGDDQFPYVAEAFPFPNPPVNELLRWGVEPHWDGDARTSCLMIRSNGLPRAQLAFSPLLSSIYNIKTWKAVCRDESYGHEHTKLPDQPLENSNPDLFTETSGAPCIIIPLHQMLVKGSWTLESSASAMDGAHWLIDARGNEALLLLALAVQFGHISEPSLRIVTNCFTAAYQMMEDRSRDLLRFHEQKNITNHKHESPQRLRFLIILVNEDSNKNWLKVGSSTELRPRHMDEVEVEEVGRRSSMQRFFESCEAENVAHG